MSNANDSLYVQCAEILGKAQDDISFQRLIHRLGQDPVLVLQNKHVSFYEYSQHGIELIYSETKNCFIAIAFFMDTPSVREGRMQRYQDTLLSNVSPDDSILQVENKLAIEPSRTKLANELTLSFNLPGRIAIFYFDGTGNSMSHLMVKLKLNVAEQVSLQPRFSAARPL